MHLDDKFGRKINYLRLSITDRCNMRCVYCMPADGVEKVGHAEILTYEQFLLIAEAAVSLGIEKIRVTGGEPLVRAGVLPFLEQLAKISGLKQLVLTTNGVLLSEMAQELKDVGVQRLNISLDSLQPEMFSQLTRRDLLPKVLAGIAAAEKAKLPYKINMVVMRGFNDNEILDFAKLTREHDCTVRFIEYMPTMKDENWRSLVVSSQEILQRLNEHYSLHSVDRGALAGPAEEFAIAGAQGCIGVIAPLSGHFCRDCNRIRITASGMVRACLFSDHEFDLKPLLATENIADIAGTLKHLVLGKPACHSLNSLSAEYSPFTMAQIGG
ncbi:GTP 3',8-cyclase MoaA [uncultured Desulfuromusa sp.]|uniref:GTP 3',8-cyclase MoaA n=1 Tax=uncultured Desulfuromusa sp. TaxID=219183 RepID=UPI002AA76735|nr:GTP 3',8-cyclase MoaA [uncultured Desulfuromusa sp.]